MVIDFNASNSSNGASRSAQTGANNGKRDAVDAPRATAQPEVSSPPPRDGGVTLSSQAQQIQTIEERLRDLPVVDNERVAQLRQAISEGTYQADSSKIADKLLALEE
ncbi:MAG: flagellar biosynthesis anti-sigma factor FlgM [Gammaproteobacteria bacterium HGW-Gammaproteobacteria-11]|nr:MAG: flagellar biosynthesis anti-sigma factor FlgM [Gammaproteobacteria bacterium HGW-Gammaproteobacteria-11]